LRNDPAVAYLNIAIRRLETEQPAEQSFRSPDEPFVGNSSLKVRWKDCP